MKSKSFLYRLSEVIVDKRNLFFLITVIGLIFSVFSKNWCSVESDLSSYLPADSETRMGLDVMEEQFTTYGTARFMIANITLEDAKLIADQIADTKGVQSVSFDDTEEHYIDAAALYQITFDYDENDERCLEVMEQLEVELDYHDLYISTSLGNALQENIGSEIRVILVYVAIIVVVVLVFTSQTYAEVPVMLITFIVAMILNMGTNFLLGKISFISNSVTSILQLALSLDYAVILCNRFKEERAHLDQREAVVTALSKAIAEISASSLTTIGGLFAMTFMQFKIGTDMAICLIKSILFALLSVFVVMPGLLMLFGPWMERTKHRNFIPKITVVGRAAYATRRVIPPLFAVVLAIGFYYSSQCPYAYGYTGITTPKLNENKIAENMIAEHFTEANFVALVMPAGDYEAETMILKELKGYEEVDYTVGLSNAEAIDGYMLTDRLTPRQFAELVGLDYEMAQILYTAYAARNEDYGNIISNVSTYEVPLMDMFLFVCEQADAGIVSLEGEMGEMLSDAQQQITNARAQLKGEEFNRVLVYLNLPEGGDETYAFIDVIRGIGQTYFPEGEVYVVGDSTTQYDFQKSFSKDNVIVSIVSILIVLVVLLCTFRSAGMPILLILVIQGAIWINFSIPYLTGKKLFFMSYLVVSSIQMGANIDYAIVIGSRFEELKRKMEPKQAMIETLNFAFPTIITSGTILAVAGTLIGKMTSEVSIVGIGESLGRGTLISLLLVMFVLPQMLLSGSKLVDKTTFAALMALVLIVQTPVGTYAGQTPGESDIHDGWDYEETIYISSEEDLREFVDNCSLDTWSQGKMFILENDISLAGEEFLSVPTFGGTFDGRGFSINGLELDQKLNKAGVFSVIQEQGIVKNLRVNGHFSGEYAEAIGGIAAVNYGLIQGCGVYGVVDGNDCVGGVVGKNQSTGIVLNCRSDGDISGKSMTGGIAGENRGFVSGCYSVSRVNTESMDPGLNLEALDLELNAELLQIRNLDTINVATDTGGIVGYSTGMVTNCVNAGNVGYQQIGYNVGGVVGRSSGAVSECKNYGSIQGRRDVGGIAGQAEPHIELTLSEEIFRDFRMELQQLSDMVDEAAYGAQSSANEISDDLGHISRTIDSILSSTEGLTDEFSELGEDVVYEVNRMGEITDEIIAMVEDRWEELEDAAETMTEAMDDLEMAMNTFSKAADLGEGSIAEMKRALQIVTESVADIQKSIQTFRMLTVQLKQGVKEKDLDATVGVWEMMLQEIQSIRTAIRQFDGGLSVLIHIRDSAGYLESASGDLAEAFDDLSWAIDTCSIASEELEEFLDELYDIVRYLDRQDEVQIREPERVEETMDEIYREMEELGIYGNRIKEDISGLSNRAAEDVRAINRQLKQTMQTLEQTIYGISEEEHNIIEDTSEAEIDNVVEGKIRACENHGQIAGDFRIGGIAGSMAIEYELDPEDDMVSEWDVGKRQKYELKVIIQECTNDAAVEAYKKYGGGICGTMDFGLIVACEGFGDVGSEQAEYIGGIAGHSRGTIQECAVKCTLAGSHKIGGIVGSAEGGSAYDEGGSVLRCYSMVRIPSYEQQAGAISGTDDGRFECNYFVSDVLAGLDRVSVSGQAEPISYDELMCLDMIPNEFCQFRLQFIVDDLVIRRYPFSYGDSFGEEIFPIIPQKENHYSRWNVETLQELTHDIDICAEYIPYVQTLKSEQQREDGRAIFLVEGQFKNEDVLEVASMEGEECWQLVIPEDGQTRHKIRVLASTGAAESVELFQKMEDIWIKLDTKILGNYVVTEVEGNRIELQIVQKTSKVKEWWKKAGRIYNLMIK